MDVFEIRRLNLVEHIANNFQSNRAAFCRATGKNPNLINLVLSDNPEYRRNIGEKLARNIEEVSAMPKEWLDQPRGIGDRNSVFLPLVTGLLPSAAPTRSEFSFTIPIDDPLLRLQATGTKNLVIYTVQDSSMSGSIEPGDHLIADLGVKKINGDGVYAMMVGGNTQIRRVQQMPTGMVRVSCDNTLYQPFESKPAEIKIQARILACMTTKKF